LLLSLRIRCVRSLNLSHNYFGDAAGPHVLEGLRLNENLTALDISHNFLGINTCHAISSGFTSNNKLKLRKVACRMFWP
jgi:Ran GTPase-activating protein (RanGAP) involved in mRNA processing and transport